MLEYDWTIAGFDPAFEGNLEPEIRHALQEGGFPRYQQLNQTACLEMVQKSDMLTAAPTSAVKEIVESGTLGSAPYPADMEFSMSAVTLMDAGTEPTVTAFLEALAAVWGG